MILLEYKSTLFLILLNINNFTEINKTEFQSTLCAMHSNFEKLLHKDGSFIAPKPIDYNSKNLSLISLVNIF